MLPHFIVKIKDKNEKSREVLKLLLSNKVISNEKTTIVEFDKIIESVEKTAKVLNEFLYNIVTNLSIQQFNQIDLVCEKTSTRGSSHCICCEV